MKKGFSFQFVILFRVILLKKNTGNDWNDPGWIRCKTVFYKLSLKKHVNHQWTLTSNRD